MVRRTFLPLLMVALLSALLLPNRLHEGTVHIYERNHHRQAKQELQMKHSLLQQDLQHTNELCRSQCTLQFKKALQRLDNEENANASAILKSMQSEYKHMQYLSLLSIDGSRKNTVIGQAPSVVIQHPQHLLQKAKLAASRGELYQSPPISANGDVWFILAMPSASAKSVLVGVIHQDVLKKIRSQQKKNLRITSFPPEKKMKVKTVDPDTLNEQKTDGSQDEASHYLKQEVVVKFRNEPSSKELEAIRKDINAAKHQKVGYTYVFRSGHMSANQLMNYFKRLDIEYVEPHFIYLPNEKDVPNDILFQQYQWNLPIIETTEGWEVTRGNNEVIVAVVDTGVDLHHMDLQNQLVDGINIVNDSAVPDDDVGHGTHVAGVISAVVNNLEGVAGMSWFNRVMPVKVLDHTGAGSTYAVAQGIIWAADHGAKVINMSLGNYAEARFLHDAIKYAFDKDVVLVAATGNDNTEQPGYPAAYPEVFAVAATDIKKQKAIFSNFGSYVDVSAPGVNIASTYTNNQYASLSGTSMACPHVAALAALIRSINPLLRNNEVMELMRMTAEDLGIKGRDNYYGFGQIDVVRALRQAEHSALSLTLWTQWLDRELEQIEQKYSIKNEPGE